MKQIAIEGGKTLTGEIKISGAKNSAVALLPAALLTDDVVIIENVPRISDIEAIQEILTYLGSNVEVNGHTIKIESENLKNRAIPEEYAKKLRASYYFMGSLLGKYKEAEMSFPGGCSIGARPIDLHLKGFESMGATIDAFGNQYLVKANELVGTDLYVKHSVGATINLLFTSVLAKGTTTIHEAAKEPEITNVVSMLQSMGAHIEGKETDTLIITGVEKLHGTNISVIPDRIEAGTYILAGALCGDHLKISNLCPQHLTALLNTLEKMGVQLEVSSDSVIVTKSPNLKPVEIKTEVYPGFPTDLQQPITALLTTANGKSKIEETIYENRFKHVSYLNDMGANIEIQSRMLAVVAPTKLTAKNVVATDLRAGACLVLASLIAEGTTLIYEVNHILRGYEDLITKLSNVGAKIELLEI